MPSTDTTARSCASSATGLCGHLVLHGAPADRQRGEQTRSTPATSEQRRADAAADEQHRQRHGGDRAAHGGRPQGTQAPSRGAHPPRPRRRAAASAGRAGVVGRVTVGITR